MRWAIFCRVIDNFGDAGVCWRLATDLYHRGEQATLYIDRPDVLNQLLDRVSVNPNLNVLSWPDDSEVFTSADIADVVIEAFACNPPTAYVSAMAERVTTGRPPIWINLEYLSAEDWVEKYHLLPSPHPRYPLIKHFYFPGFTPESGGLLREPGLAIPQHTPATKHQPLRLFLFGYQQPALQSWVSALHDTVLSVAPCVLADQLTEPSFKLANDVTVEMLPFVAQSAFDAVLAGHDILFVRGEDSFVRAQWAGKPVVWQIYPQNDGAHLHKLRAFYDRYLDPEILTEAQRACLMRFLMAWNGNGNPADCAAIWEEIRNMLPALQKNALRWRESLLKQPDLVTQLRSFVSDLVK